MAEPVSPQMAPYAVQLEPGDYYWCACGLSAKQPYCDDYHAGTTFLPALYRPTEDVTVALCGGKRTGRPPFCDDRCPWRQSPPRTAAVACAACRETTPACRAR